MAAARSTFPAGPLYRRQDDAVRGRHLVAARDIEKGRLVFAERPLLVQQNLTNVREAWVCRACHAFLGGPRAAIRHRFPPSSPSPPSSGSSSPQPPQRVRQPRDKGRATDGGAPGPDPSCDTAGAPDEAVVVPCRKGCGYAYCSPECERDAWACHHRWLCTGHAGDADHPLVQFKRYASETNEVLLAAAEWWVAQHSSPSAAPRRRRRDQQAEDQRAVGLESARGGGGDATDDDVDEEGKYTDFVMNPWWDVSVLDLLHGPGAKPGGFAEAIRIQAAQREICGEAARLLNQALGAVAAAGGGGTSDDLAQRHGGPEVASSSVEAERRAVVPPISAADVSARLGAFSQNAIGFRSRHPLCRHVYDPDFRRACHEEIVLALGQAGFLGDCPDEEEDYDDDDNEDRGGERKDADLESASDEDDNPEVELDPSQYTPEEIALLLSQLFVDEDGTVVESSSSSSSETSDQTAPARARDTTGDDLDYVFPPLDGTALYATACKMNHSCDPNVIVLFRRSCSFGRLHPLVAHCVALRDISEGDELTISYIENDRPISERQLALSSYGFTCQCAKCEREASAVPTNGEDNAVVLEDDLFGGQDENDVEPVEEGDDAVGSIEEQDGGRALEQVLERLDSRSNHSQYGSVPTPIAARLFAYLIQNGTTLIQKLGKADNPPAVDERNILARCVDGARERDFSLCRIVGCDLEDLLYRQLRRRGSWHSLIYREAYWCSVLSAAIGYAHEGSFLESLGLLDKGLILGLPRTQHSLEPFVEYVETHASQVALGPMWPCVSAAVPDYRLVDHRRAAEGPGLARGIDHAIEERHSLLSFHEFLSAFAHGGKPVVLRGFASNWSALDTMRDLRHLSRDHGHRLVPIEVGSILRRRSSDVSMKEKIMTIRQFVDSFLVPSTYQGIWSLKDAVDSPASRVAYVAQHPLMMQILALRREVVMCPDLCGPSGPSHVNAWIGTGGTRTPLHFDSYDNLLVQLVGIKYVRLYGTEDAQKLPRLTVNGKASSFGLQGNMSSLNCECEDRDECGPNESFAYSEALLFPGDCLFIPTRVWHYVRSITTSMSINYWFDVQ